MSFDDDFATEFLDLGERLALASFRMATGSAAPDVDELKTSLLGLLRDTDVACFADPALGQKLLELRRQAGVPGQGLEPSRALVELTDRSAALRRLANEDPASLPSSARLVEELAPLQAALRLDDVSAEGYRALEGRVDAALAALPAEGTPGLDPITPGSSFDALDVPLPRPMAPDDHLPWARELYRLGGDELPEGRLEIHTLDRPGFFMVAGGDPIRCRVAIPARISTLFELRAFAHEVGHAASSAGGSAGPATRRFLELSFSPSENEAYRFEVLFSEALEELLPDLRPSAESQRRLFLGRQLKFLGDAIRLRVALAFFTGASLREMNEAFAGVVRAARPGFVPRGELDFLACCGIPTSFYPAATCDAFLEVWDPLSARFAS